jgi:Gram-negative bacterial tonB protein.
MRFLTALFSILCVFTAFAAAQKTVRKSAESPPVQTSESLTPSDSNRKTSERFDTPLKILYKPQAAYPQTEGGTECFQGIVRLRVRFLDTGEIRKISVVSSLPFGATESAIEAAKKIKFEPAKKDGKPVTGSKIVEFKFSIY